MEVRFVTPKTLADNFGVTPLLEAIRAGHDSIIQILVECGAKAHLEVRNLKNFMASH